MRGIRKIVLFGPQGSGKGTQTEMLAKKYKFNILATGDFFRKEIREGSDLGNLAKKFIEKGKLVPDVVTNRVIFDELKQNKYSKGFILDGYPRNLNQLDFLEKNFGLDIIIQLDIDDKTVLKRLGGRRICPKCGAIYHLENKPPKEDGVCDNCGTKLAVRSDDRPESIKKRLGIYHGQTEPILSKYAKEKKLIKIDARPAIEKVFNKIVAQLEGKK